MFLQTLIGFFLTCASFMGTLPVDAPVEQALIERTLSIVKPDALDQADEIRAYFETVGLKVVTSKEVTLTLEEAKEFYAAHKDRPFYEELVKYMTSGPVLLQVLEGEDAIALNRQVMGSTDPEKASPGTIRADFGTNIQKNAVHGSDSPESARREISLFFPEIASER